MYFVRYGTFNLTKQKGYKKNTYHSPPTNRGFYAMPKKYQSLFLVGYLDFQKQKLKKDKDYHKQLRLVKHEFKLSKNDMIWHHLIEYTNTCDIFSRSKEWIKTTVETYEKAIGKMKIYYKSLNTPFNYICYDCFEVFIDYKIN